MRNTFVIIVFGLFLISLRHGVGLLDMHLVEMAAAGDLLAVKQCLTLGRDPNRPVGGRLPLVAAARGGQLQVVEHLIGAGAQVDGCIDVYGAPTALIAAVEEGRAKVVAFLVKAGADVNYAVTEGMRPLAIAARRGDLSVVKALLAAGASPGDADLWGRTALDGARMAGREQVCRFLEGRGNGGNGEGGR